MKGAGRQSDLLEELAEGNCGDGQWWHEPRRWQPIVDGRAVSPGICRGYGESDWFENVTRSEVG